MTTTPVSPPVWDLSDLYDAIDDPRIAEVRVLRPQEIPRYVAEGLFDLGITGRDWIEETSSEVVSLCQLHYSKATARPIKMVLAVPSDSPFQRVEDLPAWRRALQPAPAPAVPAEATVTRLRERVEGVRAARAAQPRTPKKPPDDPTGELLSRRRRR